MKSGGWRERGRREGREKVMKRARERAGGRGEGRVSRDTVVSSTDVLVALLTVSLYCGSAGWITRVPACYKPL